MHGREFEDGFDGGVMLAAVQYRMMRSAVRLVARDAAGTAILMVLVIMLALAGSSASFIWFMNQQQARAGGRYRSVAALAVAEAGVHRALSILEGRSPNRGSAGRDWRPDAYAEAVRGGPLEGRFTLALSDSPDGSILITSVGERGGATRRVRARAYLAPPALLAALHGSGFVRLESPPAATIIVPYGAGLGDRPWIHIAAGRGIWFATPDVSINNPAAALQAGPGPVDAPAGPSSATAVPRPGPVRLLLAQSAELTLGPTQTRVDVQQLRVMGAYIDGAVLRSAELPPPPAVDRTFYEREAANNTRNAALNAAAGRYFGDDDLARKRDSRFTQTEFEKIQVYLQETRQPARFRGVSYIAGEMTLVEGESMLIQDGALITEGTVRLSAGAVLEIEHSTGTRTMPGLMVLDNGALVVTRGARLRAHGLVYVNRAIEIGEAATLDVVGAVMGNDPGLSFRNIASTVVIRYDPAVLGTPALQLPADVPVVAWIASWEELP